MTISIVVPAFNEELGLGATLAAIHQAARAFHEAGHRTELIVCDNNSTDRTTEIAVAAGADVIFEPVNQIARARNRGAAAAAGEWLLFVDADSQPSYALFAEVARRIASGRTMAGGSTITYGRRQRPFVALVTWLWNMTSVINRWAAGSFIFCERRAFGQVGGFNEDLYAAEELDLFRRLKRLARQEQRRIVILHRHPLLTSDRKLRLYSSAEIMRFILKTVVGRGRTLRNPEDCFAWYDGRR